MAMISIGAFLVFVVAAGIVLTFTLIVHHFLKKASDQEPSEHSEPPARH